MNITWKYLDTPNISAKHGFEPLVSMPRCGLLPWGSSWKMDEERLTKLPECKICVRLLNN